MVEDVAWMEIYYSRRVLKGKIKIFCKKKHTFCIKKINGVYSRKKIYFFNKTRSIQLFINIYFSNIRSAELNSLNVWQNMYSLGTKKNTMARSNDLPGLRRMVKEPVPKLFPLLRLSRHSSRVHRLANSFKKDQTTRNFAFVSKLCMLYPTA